MRFVALAVTPVPVRLARAERETVVRRVDLAVGQLVVGLAPFLERARIDVHDSLHPAVLVAAARFEERFLPVRREREVRAVAAHGTFLLQRLRIGTGDHVLRLVHEQIHAMKPRLVEPIDLIRRRVEEGDVGLAHRQLRERLLLEIHHGDAFLPVLRIVHRREQQEPSVVRHGLVREVDALLAEGVRLRLQDVRDHPGIRIDALHEERRILEALRGGRERRRRGKQANNPFHLIYLLLLTTNH